MVWTEPALIPTSPTISCIVTRRSSSTFLRTWSITSLFRLVDGLPERWSLSTDARPSLKRLNHCFIWVGLKASCPKANWIFQIVSAWLSPSFWQNLMQYRCSIFSVIATKFAENLKTDEHMRGTCIKYFTERERNDEAAWKASRLRMNVRVCYHASHERFAHNLLAREKKVGYFLNRPRTSISITIWLYDYTITWLYDSMWLYYTMWCHARNKFYIQVPFLPLLS